MMMKIPRIHSAVRAVACLAFVSHAYGQDAPEMLRTLNDQLDRSHLVDRSERVRGDSGKWRDEAGLQVAPAIARKPAEVQLDDWADQLEQAEPQLTSGEDTWLIFRTQQLDDNDRLWIERIERKGRQITVVLSHAVWQGYYSKNFTWYGVYAVNLGELPAGEYEARWIVSPLKFQQFQDPGNRRDSWPGDETPDESADRTELTISFAVESAQ